MDRIKLQEIWKLMEQRDQGGYPVPVSLTYVKKSTGERVYVPSCTCTSIHAKGTTLNILYPGETKPKTIRKCLIVEFNRKSVYL